MKRTLRLELKVMADVGLLGFPNVGKSTFISSVSAAKAKVADYPFTTLVPQLGVVELDRWLRADHGQTFVVADIPGLVPGAADGAGLGIRFLKHVDRTRVLLHLIALDFADDREPLADYRVVRAELERFDPNLAQRPEVVALTKADLPEVRERYPELKEEFAKAGIDLFLISSATQNGLREVLTRLIEKLAEVPKALLSRSDDSSEP